MVPAGGVADDGYRKGVSGEGVWGGGAGGGLLQRGRRLQIEWRGYRLSGDGRRSGGCSGTSRAQDAMRRTAGAA